MHATVVWSTQLTNRNSANDIAPGDAWKVGSLIGRWCLQRFARASPWTGWACYAAARFRKGVIIVSCDLILP
jgi:hypothetical protein